MLPNLPKDSLGTPALRLVGPPRSARPLHQATASQASALERLGTAKRINRGRDDPAGLIASESLRARLADLEAQTRANDRAIAVTRTADGALSALSDTLAEARAAAVAAANTGGLSEYERNAYATEIASASAAADRIAQTTEFGGDPLLDGVYTIAIKDANLELPSVYAADLGIDESAQGDPGAAVDAIDGALSRVATARGSIGAFERQSEALTRAARVELENVAAAQSAIADADFAAEAAEASRSALLREVNLRLIGLSPPDKQRLTDLLG